MFKSNIKVWLSFTAILFFIACNSENQLKVVAKAGDKVVTVSELQDVLSFNAYPDLAKNKTRLKETVLYALLAEKILAQEAPDMVKDLTHTQQKIEQYKNEAVIEKFWDAEIFSKIQISESELKDAYFKSKEKRIVKFEKFTSQQEAQQFSDRLKAGQNFKDAVSAFGRPAGFVPVDTIEFGVGLPHIEKNVFSLKPGETGSPVKEGNWYFVFQLASVQKDIFTAEDDYLNQRGKLEKRLRREKAILSYETYQKEKLKPYLYKLDTKVFKALAVELDAYIFDRRSPLQLKENSDILRAVPKIKNRKLQQQIAVTFADGSHWSAGQLLKKMMLSPYFLEVETRGKLRKSLIVSAKHVLDDEVLLKRSRALGLDKTNAVKEQTHLWGDYLLSLETAKQLEHKESEQEAIKQLDLFLQKKAAQYKIKIYHNILDTLKIEPTNMIVLKEHFPGRTIAPSLQPFMGLPRWTAYLKSLK